MSQKRRALVQTILQNTIIGSIPQHLNFYNSGFKKWYGFKMLILLLNHVLVLFGVLKMISW